MEETPKKVDWSKIKNGEEFQSFCNKLLEFEIGNELVPFGAKGADKGIDAFFQGKYNNKEGKFIFQFKYSDLKTGVSRSRGLLYYNLEGTKTKMGEFEKIANKKPDYYYILTPLKMTVHYKEKINKLAEQYDFEVEIWDGEKLENILVKHPMVYQWFFGRELPLFTRYQDQFSDELSGKKLINYQINLVGREKEKEKFIDFIISEKNILLIYGQGGIGKTHLLIEFAKLVESQGWNQRFIRIETESFDEHLSELNPEEKYIIFLDDAHSYKNFNKLLSLIQSEKASKMKLIISTRPTFLRNFKSQILIDYEKMDISKLNNQEILEILDELKVIKTEKNIICEISNGIPLIAIMATQLINEGISIQDISSHEIIQRYFNKYLFEIQTNKGDKYIELLKILSFLVPITISNENIHKKLSKILKISIITEQLMIQDLLNEKIIEIKADKLKIIPDLMGEHLLLEASFRNGKPTGLHKIVIKNLLQFAPKQIITNLAIAEIRVDKKILLNELLEELKEEALQGDNGKKFMILSFIEDLAYLSPEETLDIIKNMLKIKKEPFNFYNRFWGTQEITDLDIRKQIAKHLKKIANSIDTFNDALEILKELTLEEGIKESYGDTIRNTFLDVCSIQFNRDIWILNNRIYYRIDFRKMILDKINSWIFKNEFLDVLILGIIEKQLNETVERVEKSLEKIGTITISEIRIPEKPMSQEMRNKFMKLLFIIGSDSPWNTVRVKVPNVIFETYMMMDRIEKREIDLNEEIKKRIKTEKECLIQYLIERLEAESNWVIIDTILEKLNYLHKWKIVEIDKKIDDILNKYEKNEEYQFSRVLIGHKDLEEIKELDIFIKTQVKHFITIFSEEQFSELLLQISKDNQYRYSYTTREFLYELGLENPDFAEIVFNKLQNKENDIKGLSGYILGGLRVSASEIALEIIERLKNTNDTYVIINSYEVLTSYNEFNENDLDFLQYLLSQVDEEEKIKICDILPNLQQVNRERYLFLLKGLSEDVTPRLKTTIIRAIIRIKFELTEEHINIIKKIIMNFLILEDVYSFDFYYVINEISKFDPLFLLDFFEKRIEIKHHIEIENEKYEVIPFSFDEAIKNLTNQKDYLKRALRRIRDWIEMGNYYFMKAPHVFCEICSIKGREINHETILIIKEVLNEWIDEGSQNKLQGVAQLLLYFPSSEWIFNIFEQIIIKSKGEKAILSSISAAINTTQAEMVSPGEPSPQSLYNIKLLESLKERSTDPHVKKFSRDQIKLINTHINLIKERVEEEW